MASPVQNNITNVINAYNQAARGETAKPEPKGGGTIKGCRLEGLRNRCSGPSRGGLAGL